jgi:ankyrin repeat protein
VTLGHLECLSLLVNQLGAEINGADLQGQTALHAAVKLQDPVPTIHFLLRAGIEKNLTDRQGLSAMQVALAIMNIPALEALGGRHLEKEKTGLPLGSASLSSGESFLDMSSNLSPTASSKYPNQSRQKRGNAGSKGKDMQIGMR